MTEYMILFLKGSAELAKQYDSSVHRVGFYVPPSDEGEKGVYYTRIGGTQYCFRKGLSGAKYQKKKDRDAWLKRANDAVGEIFAIPAEDVVHD